MKKKKLSSDRIFAASVMLPAIIFLGTVFYYPFFKNIYFMFHKYNYVSKPQFVGLDNIKQLFGDASAARAFMNTFQITVISVPLVLFVSLVLAISVFNVRFGKNFLKSAFFTTYLVPSVVASVIFKLMFGTELGFVNSVLGGMGIGKIAWLSKPLLAKLCIVIVHIWNGTGYYMLIFFAGLSNVDFQLYEAARVDGAGMISQFFHVTLPQLKPTIIFSALYATISYLKTYVIVQVLTEGGPYGATETAIKLIFDQGFTSRNVGYASVLAITLFLIILCVTGIQMAASKRMNGED